VFGVLPFGSGYFGQARSSTTGNPTITAVVGQVIETELSQSIQPLYSKTFPGTTATQTPTTGVPQWPNPAAVLLDNGNSTNVNLTANFGSGQTSAQLLVTGFGFAVPATSIVAGIRFLVDEIAQFASTMADGASPQLYRSSGAAVVAVGTAKPRASTFWNNSSSRPTFGNDSDLWGTAWTPAQINDTNFGVGYAAQNVASGSATSFASVQFFSLTVFWTPAVTSHTLTVNQTPETDSTQVVTPSKALTFGQTFETDLAQPVPSAKNLVFGQTTETELAQPMVATHIKTITVDQAPEAELAQPVTWAPKIITLGQVVETELAQTISTTRTKIGIIDIASESELAQPISRPLVAGVVQVFENEFAQQITTIIVAAIRKNKAVSTEVIWKFELVRSSDMSRLFELSQARSRVLQLALNKAGSFSFVLPLEDKNSIRVQEVSTAVVIYRNGLPVWSGPVWTVQETTPNSIQVGCVGWLQTLEKRISKIEWGNPLYYTKVDAGLIAQDLLARSNTSAGGNPSYVFPGNSEISQVRTRTYAPYVNILTEINALTTIESGFDILVHPATRAMNIYSKLSKVQPQLLFDYGRNVASITRNSDAARMCNRMIAYSSGGSAQVDDAESQRVYGVFEEAASLADVVDMSILQAYAAAEVAIRSRPLRIATFVPRPFSTQRPNDPRIFEDFNIGDVGYLNVDKGRLKLQKQAVRVFGAAVAFNDNGTESITSVQTTAS
jgi:hypothetical protein